MRIATAGDAVAGVAVPRALHPVSGPGEDRNDGIAWWEITAQDALHPVSGPGEDRNPLPVYANGRAPISLHPVSGPGEDRNFIDAAGWIASAIGWLHPVSGPGEDRNDDLLDSVEEDDSEAAPGLRTG